MSSTSRRVGTPLHMGQNLDTEPVILDVVYLVPIGSPLFENVPTPACE
jgi:hypothetical protein